MRQRLPIAVAACLLLVAGFVLGAALGPNGARSSVSVRATDSSSEDPSAGHDDSASGLPGAAGAVASPDVAGHGDPRAPDGSADASDSPADGSRETAFTADFDQNPDAPQPFVSPEWDLVVHSRDPETWEALETVDAHHGPACEPPMATHAVTAYEDAVFSCKNHLMTTLNASGYGVIYLTPNHLIDLSEGEAVVKFDMSTLRTSRRDWVDVWITPYDEHLSAPLEASLPDLAGPPRNAVQVRMGDARSGTRFEVKIYENHEPTVLQGERSLSYDSFLTPDAKRRDTFELRLSQTHVTFGMPDYDKWWIDEEIPALGWGQGVVQFGHHSYNPTKDAGGTPNTWHWDNVALSPTIPFTMIGSSPRRVSGQSEVSTVQFDRPAPADAHLRFSGMGESVEVSLDGGTTWEEAATPPQLHSKGLSYSNYWMSVPEGTTSVAVRGDGGWVGDWIAKDFSIWSREP